MAVGFWVVAVMLGGATFALRSAFLVTPLRVLPPLLQRALPLVPTAILAALVASALVPTGSGTTLTTLPQLGAGGVTLLLAWRTKSIFLAVCVGMETLWLLQRLPLPA